MICVGPYKFDLRVHAVISAIEHMELEYKGHIEFVFRLFTDNLASESFKMSLGQFSNVNRTLGEHGRPAYNQSLLIFKFNALFKSTSEGKILTRNVSTIRKKRTEFTSNSMPGLEIFEIDAWFLHIEPNSVNPQIQSTYQYYMGNWKQ